MNTKEQLLDKLEAQLASHDWYYHFSDDPFVYRQGKKSKTNILATMNTLSKMGYKDDSQRLYQKYSKGYAQSIKGEH